MFHQSPAGQEYYNVKKWEVKKILACSPFIFFFKGEKKHPISTLPRYDEYSVEFKGGQSDWGWMLFILVLYWI